MKILVTTPLLVVPPRGACEHDRVAGIAQLVRLGHDVRVFSFVAPWQRAQLTVNAEERLGCPVTFVPYEPVNPKTIGGFLARGGAALRKAALVDGSAAAVATSDVRHAFDAQLDAFAPDLAWFDYTNIWPLAEQARARGIPCIVRSLNYEPRHNLHERGKTAGNYARYFAKYLSERASMGVAGAFAAITPADRADYLRLGRSDCEVLPLRALPSLLRAPRPPRDQSPLQVFFFSSNYAVSHNRAALLFAVREILPEVRRRAPGAFHFHILGGKVPPDLLAGRTDDLTIHGFLDDLDAFFCEMDIALVPSLYGGGMQQKIFEPLCRAFPSVISARGVGGYPVRHGEHALLVDTREEFVDALLSLRDPAVRARLSAGASAFGMEQFSQPRLDAVVERLLSTAAGRLGSAA